MSRILLPAFLILTFAQASLADDRVPADAAPPGPPAAAVPAKCFENPRLPGCPYWCRFHRSNVVLCPPQFYEPKK